MTALDQPSPAKHGPEFHASFRGITSYPSYWRNLHGQIPKGRPIDSHAVAELKGGKMKTVCFSTKSFLVDLFCAATAIAAAEPTLSTLASFNKSGRRCPHFSHTGHRRKVFRSDLPRRQFKQLSTRQQSRVRHGLPGDSGGNADQAISLLFSGELHRRQRAD